MLLDMPVSFAQAALGAEIEVPTLDGRVKYTMPAGTQTGTVFRLRGKGIPELNSKTRGDQFVTVYIEVPRNLTARQKELLKEFEGTFESSENRGTGEGRIKGKRTKCNRFLSRISRDRNCLRREFFERLCLAFSRIPYSTYRSLLLRIFRAAKTLAMGSCVQKGLSERTGFSARAFPDGKKRRCSSLFSWLFIRSRYSGARSCCSRDIFRSRSRA